MNTTTTIWIDQQTKFSDGTWVTVQMAEFETEYRIITAAVFPSAKRPNRWILSLADQGISFHDSEDLAKKAAAERISAL